MMGARSEGVRMEWWHWKLLAVWLCMVGCAVAAVWVEQRHLAHGRVCPMARRVMKERHPNCRVTGSQHRASEADRDVVAVFYSPPPRTVIEPPPYWLVAVGRNGVVEELSDEAGSPYRMTNYK